MNEEIYEVLKHKDFTGLTVGHSVLTPGQTFSGDQWNFGKDCFDSAIKNKRCILMQEKQVAKDDAKAAKAKSE